MDQFSSSASVVIPRLMVVMFTDLVNSSLLKRELGHEHYRLIKVRHDSLIHQALAIAPTSKALQDTGDGYFISFGSVTQAISAALVFQWLMAREPWPHDFKARVGMHLGEVEEGTSQVTGQADFISSAIDLASRTMSLAAGGQILMTRTVFEAGRHNVRHHPPISVDAPLPAVKWVSHGQYCFKGFDEPVDIFEVGAEGIAPLQPPADSEKAKRHLAPVSGASQLHPSTITVGDLPGHRKQESTSRRNLLATAVGVSFIAAAGAIAVWTRRPDPMVEMQRKQIEREIALITSHPPRTATVKPENVTVVDRVQVSDNAAFDVLNDSRVIDMRGWKEVPHEKLGEHYSQITMTRRLHLKKNKPVKLFEVQSRTTGLDVVLSCDESFPYSYEAQRSEVFVEQERMKLRKLAIDVSSVDVGREFNLHVISTFWNSMQTKSEQWFGLIGYKKSFVASMLLLFPTDKPFIAYTLKYSRTEKDTAVDFVGPRIVLEGENHDWIYWEIPNPEPGHVYRLHWNW